MTRHGLLALTFAAAIVSVAPVPAAQPQQPRDVAASTGKSGTAFIGGVVTSQGDNPRPLRRVLVTLSGSAVTGNVQVTTDDSGRFAFPDLPAGRYSLTAEKPAHVKTYYGSKLVGRGPGTPIALAEGQRMMFVLTLLRGAVIEGTVFDENGVPLSDAQVRAMQPVVVNGERRFVNPQGPPRTTSDDRGVYRLYGLPPGEYTVLAGGGGGLRGETRLTTTAEIDAALRELRESPPRVGTQPAGGGAPLVSRSGAYFPGVTDAALAEFITLAAGQERTGVDLRSPLVRPTRLAGTAVGPAGQPLRTVMIGVANASAGTMYTSLGGISPRQDGRFSVTLTPGRYLFFGRGTESGPIGNPSLLPLWTSAEVDVNEQDFLDLMLQFLPGTSVSGRIAFRGSQTPPDATKIRLVLGAVPTIAGTALTPPAMSPQADGSFAFTNVPPGKYRLSMTGGGSWSLRSAMVNGRDTLDQPLDVPPGQDVPDVAVTSTDQPTEITGTLLDQLGRPTPEYAIVAFSTDRAYWSTAPRRVSGVVKAGSDGRFSVTGLPPGEYFLTALTDPDPSQLRDQSFLEQVAGSAIRVTLAEGEKKVQDFKLSGSGGD